MTTLEFSAMVQKYQALVYTVCHQLVPEQQVLDTMGEEELTNMILALREPYKTPCRLVLLESIPWQKPHSCAAARPRRWKRRSIGLKRCWRSRYLHSRKTTRGGAYMELFDETGCLTDEGLRALQAGHLDELCRLEAAEHLSYCDKCTDRYTALLTADMLEEPPRSARKAVMTTIWVRLMQNTWGRAAVAGVAAVLAFTMWRSGTVGQLLDFRQQMHSWVPETSQSQTEETGQLGSPIEDSRQPAEPETLGQPVENNEPRQQASLAKALNDLLFGAHGPAAEKNRKSPLTDQTK